MTVSATTARRSGPFLGVSYDERNALLFTLPFAVVLFAVAVFPVVYSFYISLYSLKLTRPHRVPFVWFDNYWAVLSDPQFWDAVYRTTAFSAMAVAAISVLGLQALHEAHGLQCGFCIPGIVLTMEAWLAENPSPSEAEIRDALSGNLCRCTGYHNIVVAIARAAAKLRQAKATE